MLNGDLKEMEINNFELNIKKHSLIEKKDNQEYKLNNKIKEIEVNKLKLKERKNRKLLELLKLQTKLKENQVIRLFNNRETQILNHLRKLLEVRKDQFKDIEINYRFTNTGFNLHRINGQLFVINLRADLDTKFKND